MAWTHSKAFARNFALIDWSGFKPSPNKARHVADRADFHVIRDIDPYRSAVTGEVIGGRRQHREHLRAHNLVEVGNDRMKPQERPRMPDARPEIAQVMREKGLIG